jgi:hypothetical protein
MVGSGLVLCLALLAVPGAAEEPGEQCRVDILPKAQETEFPLLYQPRHDELTLEARYLGSSLPVLSAVGFGLMYSFAPFDQQLHLGLRAGGTAGEWGSDRRHPIALTLGGRVAVDFLRPMNGVFDLYALVQADALLFAAHGDPVLRPGAGVGVRVVRTIGLELTFDPLVSLGTEFANGEKFVGGFGVGLSYDFCTFGGFCDEETHLVTEHDLTKKLYATVVTIAPKDEIKRQILCAAVAVALDATRYHPHDDIDSTEAFIRGIAENLTDPTLRADIEKLRTEHVAWRTQRAKSRAAARTAAAAGHDIAEHCVYEPFPQEIRATFGCDALDRSGSSLH